MQTDAAARIPVINNHLNVRNILEKENPKWPILQVCTVFRGEHRIQTPGPRIGKKWRSGLNRLRLHKRKEAGHYSGLNENKRSKSLCF